MPLTGDFSELDELVRKLQDIESGQARRDLVQNLAEESIELVHQGFEQSKDPYGNAWAGLEARDGKPLLDTGALRNSWHVVSFDDTSFKIAAGVWYAGVHQTGITITPREGTWDTPRGPRPRMLVFTAYGRTVFAKEVTIPARRMVPDSGDLSDQWRSALEETSIEFLEAFFSFG